AQGVQGDKLVIERTGDPVPRVGEMDGGSVHGLGIGDISYGGLEGLRIDLGAGSDRFTIRQTSPGTVTTVNDGGGADEALVHGISNVTSIFGNTENDGAQGNGDGRPDTVTVVIPGDPNALPGDPTDLSQSPFGGLRLSVDRLHVDNSANSTASAVWLS